MTHNPVERRRGMPSTGRMVGVAGLVVALAACTSSGEPHRPELASKIQGLCGGYAEEMIADGLPAAESRTEDRAHVESVMALYEQMLREDFPGVVDLEVGPGFGAVWEGENGGAYTVEKVDDYAIVATMASRGDCPTGNRLHQFVNGVPVLFAVDQ